MLYFAPGLALADTGVAERVVIAVALTFPHVLTALDLSRAPCAPQIACGNLFAPYARFCRAVYHAVYATECDVMIALPFAIPAERAALLWISRFGAGRLQRIDRLHDYTATAPRHLCRHVRTDGTNFHIE